MSEPMEDKRLERGVEEIAKRILASHREASPTCALVFTEQAIVEALQAERDKLRVVEAERDEAQNQHILALNAQGITGEAYKTMSIWKDELLTKNATLQSQITAFKSDVAGLRFSLNKAVVKAEGLQDQLTTIKELINGASLHGAGTETGVSLVDDVRDLVKENAALKAKIVKLGYSPIKSYRRDDGINIPEGWHEMGG